MFQSPNGFQHYLTSTTHFWTKINKFITFIFVHSHMRLMLFDKKGDVAKPQNCRKHLKNSLLIFLANLHDVHGSLRRAQKQDCLHEPKYVKAKLTSLYNKDTHNQRDFARNQHSDANSMLSYSTYLKTIL